MRKSKVISLVVLALLCAFTVHARATYYSSEPWEYDPMVPEWMRTFYKGDLGGPEYRGPWVYGIQKLGNDQFVDEGWTPTAGWEYVYRSRGDNHNTNFWDGPGDAQISGLSFSNDISTWLAPPEGKTRSIRYVVLNDWSGGGGPNNTDIIEIDENQVEILLKHGYYKWNQPHDTLGQPDPWGYADVAISGLDCKADLAPHRGGYDHISAINDNSTEYNDDYYLGRPWWKAGQSEEDVYFSSGYRAWFDSKTYLLEYGIRPKHTWGNADGSGYGKPGSATFDTSGTAGSGSGEEFCRYAAYTDGRWWNYVVISDTSYWMYLDDGAGSIKAYDPGTYPEDSGNPGDPEYASGYPIRWHDDYALYLAGDITTDPGAYGISGRYVIERSNNLYREADQAYCHAGDIVSETRTYNPYVNGCRDGPESAYDWLYDESGDMYTPIWYCDGVARTPYAGEWDDDTPYERALHLKAIKADWTLLNGTSGGPGTPPDEEHDWQYVSEDPPGTHNWRTFTGYSGADQHPAYPDDDQKEIWTEWEFDPETRTWSSYDAEDDVDWKHESPPGGGDEYVGLNRNDGIVSQQYFEYAWKIAGKLLGDRFWENGYVWSNELGCVVTREYVEDDFVHIIAEMTLRLPNMYWDGSLEEWRFATSSTDTSYPTLWSWMGHYVEHPVPEHDALNNFLVYVMDIDALVVQDVNGNGVYDEEEDYILFSLVDDSRYYKALEWHKVSGTETDAVEAPFAGRYFSGETIFLYHNCEIATYFDPGTGIFFGESIATATTPATLWAFAGMYELNALDIGLVPEPATIILIIGGGLAFGAGLLRKKMR